MMFLLYTKRPTIVFRVNSFICYIFYTLLKQAGLVRSHTYIHTYTLTINLVILIISIIVIVTRRDLND